MIKFHVILRVVLLSLVTIAPLRSYGWGKKGHDIIAHIAECNLSDGVRNHVETMLGGHSMVYYANWLDSASHTKEYSYSKPWHFFNMEKRDRVESAKRSRKGDLLSALTMIEERLSDVDISADDESLYLKMLIHLVGDMHQPMHLGQEVDEGGNTIPVVYFVKSVTLHSMWDYDLVEGVHTWSYREWREQIDRPSLYDKSSVVAGSYSDWLNATHEITVEIYRKTPFETRAYYDYQDWAAEIIEQQLLYAGLRLAAILERIYIDRPHK